MSSLDKLESAFVECAENRQFATLNTLLDALEEADKGPSLSKCLQSGATLLFDGYSSIDKDAIQTAVNICRHGVAPAVMRDYLANAARKSFSAYSDPAGLVASIGCNDSEQAPERIANNWQTLCFLLSGYADSKLTGIKKSKKALQCYIQKFGFGVVEEVDPFSDLIVIAFKLKQKMNLESFIKQCHLVIPGTLAHELLTGKKYDTSGILSSDLSSQLEHCLSPSVKFTQAMLTRILMPKHIKSVKAFQSWYLKKSLAVDVKSSAASGTRNWGNSRSLAELNDHLPKDPITPDEDQKANLQKIFKFAAAKPLQVQLYSELLCVLWEMCTEKEIIEEIVEMTAEHAVVWADKDDFSAVTDKMSAKHLHAWFHVTINARGVDWLVSNCLDLPLKYWNYMDKALEEFDGIMALTEVARTQIKTGTISADPLMWMWSRFKAEHRFLYDIMGNPALVLRTLGREVRGNHIKASKDLRKLLMESEDFQRFVMDEGSETGIAALVSAVRSMPSLDLGERQSLLVRIVRLYPERKNLVEERKVEISKKEMTKVTSLRSYEQKKKELDDIVKNKIPQNIEAIATARDYGDLRENFEFKAAKDMQKMLAHQRGELEQALDEIKPSDFSEFVFKDRVLPATVVTIDDNGESKDFTILGIWDGAPEKGFIAFDTPLGKALLGHQVGDEIDLPAGGEAEITAIVPASAELLDHLAMK